ncbi:MAG TPA: ATP-grasp domain-containing protein [Desulfuromonadales bacterium]|nr:ATP-grasp domain-containing protein [Desulfuromonadales bacterium]
MPTAPSIDRFFELAEQLASDFSLLKGVSRSNRARQKQEVELALAGLVDHRTIEKTTKYLKSLDVDAYIRETVEPSEQKGRIGFKAILKQLKLKIVNEISLGPLHCVEAEFDFNGYQRRLCLLAQDRNTNNGVWGPEHHRKAIEIVRKYERYSVPVITFIDTPGADAGEVANANNQAHSISHFIAEMANLNVPSVGIILGNGYSGGAIPMATTNILLSVRDGVLNTIQPKGLAAIARSLDLSWQECAKYVGVSAYELYQQDFVDGIIDYVPGEKGPQLENLRNAIVSAVTAIENRAIAFVKETDGVMDHYRENLLRYINPSEKLKALNSLSALSLTHFPTEYFSVFGITYRYMRYLSLRGRIKSTSSANYSRSTNLVTPRGDLSLRVQEEQANAFSSWLEKPLHIRYDDLLSASYKTYLDRKEHLGDERGRLSKLILGNPSEKFEKALQTTYLAYGFHLYNLWKSWSQNNFVALIKYLGSTTSSNSAANAAEMTVLDVITLSDFREGMIRECQNCIIFDLVYDQIITDLRPIAAEAKDTNTFSKKSFRALLESSIHAATDKLKAMFGEGSVDSSQLEDNFYSWLNTLLQHPQMKDFIRPVQEWKKIQYPRISEPLFAIVTFLFEKLLLEYVESEREGRAYDGRINLRDIGMKDFWNRLTTAYNDLLIQDVLLQDKRGKNCRFESIVAEFFTDFKELDADLMTSDPANFPGFRLSIEKALDKGIKPCGVLTGLAKLKKDGDHPATRVGVLISNLDFQAGAFDMPSAEKFCNLLLQCARRKLPVVAFVSSGGMNTKEGAGSLFSMSIVNDRITRFIRDNELPIICFGFGDCTGGAQASFVTHPLAQTYYFSGCGMPFAGQIVVPSYLPSTVTLSNYLSCVPGAMQGLVKHPFNHDLDKQLRAIDPAIPTPVESVMDVCHRVFKGLYRPDVDAVSAEHNTLVDERSLLKPVKRTLIHARGCTAAKLVLVAQREGIEVVLVQSDADMDSAVAAQLTENDTLVCIGGNTPDESYLNAKSVLRIAEQQKVDSLHPGIGFLSENADFALMCRNRGINFVGPWFSSMELMGNKTNAIDTATKAGVPVVPGSHGIIGSVETGMEVAETIGYPVLLKAVHGGGGKGIKVVEKPEDFREFFFTISSEARAAFGSGDIYLEKYVTNLRHIEVQILRDAHGNCRILGLRDCSVQRNNQKIFEESGSTMLPKNLEQDVLKYAELIANQVDYIGAGTVEFIFNLDEMAIYFMEMNTRLQVEHPVTEQVTGVDIVANQFKIAGGGSIADIVYKPKGYAIEARITAERTAVEGGNITFIPTPGNVTAFSIPQADHIKVIKMIEAGKPMTPYYDSLMAQVIVTGKDRNDAADKLLAALEGTVIQGVHTNIPLLKRVLKDETFRKGIYNTQYLPGFLESIDVDEMIAEAEVASGTDQVVLDRSAVEIEGSNELKVLSPSTGVFYDASSPSEPPFAPVGKEVKLRDTIGLLEAMKLFAPVSLNTCNPGGIFYDADKTYEIVRIIPTPGQAVNKGDLLFVVKEAV